MVKIDNLCDINFVDRDCLALTTPRGNLYDPEKATVWIEKVFPGERS